MTVLELWKPILLSGIATHILSTLAWTALPHHKPEWTRIPSEDDLLDLFGKQQIPPGQYIFPFASNSQEASQDTYKQRLNTCRGMLVLWPTPTNMGKAIGLTLVSFLIIAFVLGYLASKGLDQGDDFMTVLQFVTTAGLLAHISAKFPFVFWFRRKILMDVVDGVVFAVTTGLIFAALWPR